MAITLVAAGSASTANYNTVTPGLPAGIQAGDVLLCFAFIRNRAATLSIDQGWSTHGNYPHTSQAGRIYVFYKVAGASETGPTVTPGGGSSSNDVIAQIAAFRGVDTSTPFDTSLAGTSSSSTATGIGPIGGFTPAGADACVLVLGAKIDDFASTVDTLTQAGQTFVEIGEPDSTAGNDAGIVWDYAIIAGAAVEITAKTFTVNDAGFTHWLGGMLALKPAASGPVEGSGTLPLALLLSPVAGGATVAILARMASSSRTLRSQGPNTVSQRRGMQ